MVERPDDTNIIDLLEQYGERVRAIATLRTIREHGDRAALDTRVAQLQNENRLIAGRIDALMPVDVDQSIEFTMYDAPAYPNDRVIMVPVKLNKPADRTMIVSFMTSNGANTYNTAWEPASTGEGNYIGNAGVLIFQPGDNVKYVRVRLLKELSAGYSIIVSIKPYLGWPIHAIAKKAGRIFADMKSSVPKLPDAESVTRLPPKPNYTNLLFSDDLLSPEFASDAGTRSDGVSSWQSRPSHGRTQDNNKELGYYADPALHPGCTVWGVGDDGKRYIQAESHPDGVKDRAGAVMTNTSGGSSKPFVYSAAMITSRRLFSGVGPNTYVEARFKLDNVQGTWPAFWLMPQSGAWPPEVDILEAFIDRKSYPVDLFSSGLHWGTQAAHKSYTTGVPLSKIVPGADLFAQYNNYGCWINDDMVVFYFNDQPYCSMPRTIGHGRWYILLNVAVGGLVGQPPPDAKFPARMSIEHVKVWS